MDFFPLVLSLKVAVLATVISVVLALLFAALLQMREFRGKEVLDAALTLPLVLPPTVLGYYLLVLLGRETWLGKLYEAVMGSPLVFTWHAAVVAAVVHSAPLLLKYFRAAVESVDPMYVRSAQSLGVADWRIFLQIVVPLARRGMIASTALAFARSLGDFGVTIMLAGNIPGKTQTLSVAIYDAVEAGNTGLAQTLVLVISAVGILSVWLANRMNPPTSLHS